MKSKNEGSKSNKICDNYYNNRKVYEVCVLKGETTQVFDDIRSAIKRIFLTSYTSWEYIPNEFYVTTMILPRNAYYKNVNLTTRSKILSELDPDEIYIRGESYTTNCWIRTSLYSPASPFIDSVNKHRIYNDSYNTFRFIAWIPELALTSIPPIARTTHESWYTGMIDTMPYSRPNEFLIISICLAVILFVSLCVAFIIRRAKMRNVNQNDNPNLYDNLSDSEVLSNDMDQSPPNQTTYPIFVTTNPMTTNPIQVNPQPYPIFVTTNPMTTNPMTTNPQITNPQITNPIVFPQPTLFYPQTNQN